MAKKVTVNGKSRNASVDNKRRYLTKKFGWMIQAQFRRGKTKAFRVFPDTEAGHLAADAWMAKQEADFLAKQSAAPVLPNGLDLSVKVPALLASYVTEWERRNPDQDFAYDDRKQLERTAAHPLMVDLKLGEISFETVEAWAIARRNTTTSRGTKVHQSSVLREYAVFRHAITQLCFWKKWNIDPLPAKVRKGLREGNLVAESTCRDVRPSQSQMVAIRDGLAALKWGKSVPVVDIYDVAILNAFRQAEVGELRWSEFHPEQGYIKALRKDSSNKETGRSWKLTPLVEYIVEVISRQPRKPGILVGEVTPGVEPGSTDDLIFPYDMKNVGKRFADVVRKLGIADLRWHDLRHEAASMLFRLFGIKAMQFTGHKTQESFFRYVNPDGNEMHDLSKATGGIRPVTQVPSNVVPIRQAA